MVAPRALADSRLAAKVTLHQRGYAGQKAMLTVRDGGKVLAGRQITLAGDGADAERNLFCSMQATPEQRRSSFPSIRFRARKIATTIPSRGWSMWSPPSGASCTSRASRAGNINSSAARSRMTGCSPSSRCCGPAKIKFTARGSKIRRNWPTVFRRARRILFPYQAIIIGSVEANYFTAAQKELIQQFVDRRGGGLLFLGGRASLGDGGWAASSLADLLPVTLPNKKGTFHRDPATVSLTAAGADNIITRLVEDPAAQRGALEKTSLFDGLPGSGNAEAGRGGAGGIDRRRAKDAAADHGKLRARAHCHHGHRAALGAGR